MAERPVSLWNVWKDSGKALKGNWGFSILAVLIVGGIKAGAGQLICIFLAPLDFGLLLYFLRQNRREPLPLEILFQPFQNYWHYLWGSLRPALFVSLWAIGTAVPGIVLLTVLYVLEMVPPEILIVLGVLLFLVPMQVVSYRYALTAGLMLDDLQLSAKDAMKYSCALMKGYKLRLYGANLLLLFLVAVITLFTLGIGLIWCLPRIFSFSAEFYRVRMEAEKNDADPQPEPAPSE